MYKTETLNDLMRTAYMLLKAVNEKYVCTLANNTCVPCKGHIPPMVKDQINAFLSKLKSSWVVNSAGHLYKEFKFPDFVSAMKFANNITKIAEQEGHHPNLHLTWGFCGCEIWTHKIEGLTESDFFLAAKIELLSSSKDNDE